MHSAHEPSDGNSNYYGIINLKADYYAVLGIEPTATIEEIKKAYHRLMLQYHPDRNQGDAEKAERAKCISDAYSVLGYEDKKAYYDQYRNTSGISEEEEMHAAHPADHHPHMDYYDEGMYFYEIGDFNNAYDAFHDALEHGSSAPREDIHAMLGMVHLFFAEGWNGTFIDNFLRKNYRTLPKITENIQTSFENAQFHFSKTTKTHPQKYQHLASIKMAEAYVNISNRIYNTCPNSAYRHYKLYSDILAYCKLAIDHYTQAIHRNTRNLAAFIGRPAVFHFIAHLCKQRADYERSNARNKKPVPQLYGEMKRYFSSCSDISDYERAITLNPTYIKAHLLLGDAYYEKEEYHAALYYYDFALRLNPKLARNPAFDRVYQNVLFHTGLSDSEEDEERSFYSKESEDSVSHQAHDSISEDRNDNPHSPDDSASHDDNSSHSQNFVGHEDSSDQMPTDLNKVQDDDRIHTLFQKYQLYIEKDPSDKLFDNTVVACMQKEFIEALDKGSIGHAFVIIQSQLDFLKEAFFTKSGRESDALFKALTDIQAQLRTMHPDHAAKYQIVQTQLKYYFKELCHPYTPRYFITYDKKNVRSLEMKIMAAFNQPSVDIKEEDLNMLFQQLGNLEVDALLKSQIFPEIRRAFRPSC